MAGTKKSGFYVNEVLISLMSLAVVGTISQSKYFKSAGYGWVTGRLQVGHGPHLQVTGRLWMDYGQVMGRSWGGYRQVIDLMGSLQVDYRQVMGRSWTSWESHRQVMGGS